MEFCMHLYVYKLSRQKSRHWPTFYQQLTSRHYFVKSLLF